MYSKPFLLLAAQAAWWFGVAVLHTEGSAVFTSTNVYVRSKMGGTPCPAMWKLVSFKSEYPALASDVKLTYVMSVMQDLSDTYLTPV